MNKVDENEIQTQNTYAGDISLAMKGRSWGRSISLRPGLELWNMEVNVSRNMAVDFQRNHAFLEFGCLLSGRIRGFAHLGDGTEQEFGGGPGQTWCSFQSRAQGAIEYLSGQPICSVLFIVSGPLLADFLPVRLGGEDGRTVLEHNDRSFSAMGELTPAVRQVVRQLLHADRPFDATNRLFFISKAYELLFHLFGPGGEGEVVCHEPFGVRRAREILDQNMAAPPSLADLARQCGLCVTSLSEDFRRRFGTTVFGYLRQRRLERAKELMTLYGKSASEAAWDVGYSSLSSFHRAFFERYGVTPGSFSRKLHLLPCISHDAPNGTQDK